MTAFMAFNDLESSADCESNSRDKWIPEANVVHVLSACPDDEFTAGFVAGKESIENGEVDPSRGPDLRRGVNTLATGRGLDKPADKPAPEPSGSDLLDRRIRLFFEGGENRPQIGFVGDAEMFKTLADAPRAGCGLPIELFPGESGSHRPRGLIVCA